MARAGMATLITTLRGMCAVGTADYTSGGSTWWTDDQLQARLDASREDVYRAPLDVQTTYSGGTAVYYDYYLRHAPKWLETAESGATAWDVQNANGSSVGTANYTANYDAGHIRFTADQAGTAYYLTYRAYDLHASAAEVWEAKAASVADRFDVRTDATQLNRSQIYAMYMAAAKEHRRKVRGRAVAMTRGDMSWDG